MNRVKIKCIISLLLLACFFGGDAQQKDDSVAPYIIKDKRDKNGMLIEKDYYRNGDTAIYSKEFYLNGKLNVKEFYSDSWLMYRTNYDEKGREERTIAYSMLGKVNDSCLFNYNPDGTYTNTTYDNHGIKLSKETYDKARELTEVIHYEPGGKMRDRGTIKYINKKGSTDAALERTYYDSNNVKVSTDVGSGKHEEQTIFYPSGKIMSYMVAEDVGTYMSYITQMDIYLENGSYSKTSYEVFKHQYYSRSKPGKIDYFQPDGKLQKRSVVVYDSSEHEVENDWYDGTNKPMYKDLYTNDDVGRTKDILRVYPDGKKEDIVKDGKSLKP
jgi:antitoxin component YwqK of YwqJK toxin-antitoxin module